VVEGANDAKTNYKQNKIEKSKRRNILNIFWPQAFAEVVEGGQRVQKKLQKEEKK